jgi:hypothetical protein
VTTTEQEKGRRDDRRSQLLERATDRKQRVSASNGHPAKGDGSASCPCELCNASLLQRWLLLVRGRRVAVGPLQ